MISFLFSGHTVKSLRCFKQHDAHLDCLGYIRLLPQSLGLASV